MSFGSLMDAMQDCVNINSESVGRGIDYMLTHKRTWFAISWNIEIRRIPKMFEEISVKTWAYEFATSIGYRNVIVTDENGEDIVREAKELGALGAFISGAGPSIVAIVYKGDRDYIEKAQALCEAKYPHWKAVQLRCDEVGTTVKRL